MFIFCNIVFHLFVQNNSLCCQIPFNLDILDLNGLSWGIENRFNMELEYWLTFLRYCLLIFLIFLCSDNLYPKHENNIHKVFFINIINPNFTGIQSKLSNKGFFYWAVYFSNLFMILYFKDLILIAYIFSG